MGRWWAAQLHPPTPTILEKPVLLSPPSVRKASQALRAPRVPGMVLPGTVGAPGSGGLLRLVPPYADLRGVALAAHATLDGVLTAALQVVVPLALVAPHRLLII